MVTYGNRLKVNKHAQHFWPNNNDLNNLYGRYIAMNEMLICFAWLGQYLQ